MSELFSGRLEKALRLANMKAAKLAKLAKMTPAYVSELRTGRKERPSPELAQRMAAALNVSVSWLLCGDGEMLPVSLTPREYLATAVRAAGGITNVCQQCGIRETDALRRVVEGGYPLRESLAQAIASGLDLDLERLLSGSDEPRVVGGGPFVTAGSAVVRDGVVAYEPKNPKVVPIIGIAAAGPGCWGDGDFSHEGIMFPDVTDRRAFAVRVTGDSMQPHYIENDIVLVYPSHEVRQGGIAVVGTTKGDHLLKIFHRSGDHVTLTSYNPNHPPMPYSSSEIEWAYPVAGMQRPASYFLP